MTTDQDIIVLCAGGHARVVIDILRRSGHAVAALADNNSALHGTMLDDVQIVGADSEILARDPKSVVLFNALGNTPKSGDNALSSRRKLFEKFKNKGYAFVQVISPQAVVSERARLGEGCHIITGAIVHPGCSVGANTIINTGAQLDHDCQIGDHSHIAPGAVLGGTVCVGHGCHIGAGAIVVQGLTIGDGAVVGAGAVVIKDVAPGTTVVGNPAKRITPLPGTRG